MQFRSERDPANITVLVHYPQIEPQVLVLECGVTNGVFYSNRLSRCNPTPTFPIVHQLGEVVRELRLVQLPVPLTAGNLRKMLSHLGQGILKCLPVQRRQLDAVRRWEEQDFLGDVEVESRTQLDRQNLLVIAHSYNDR